MSRLTNSNTLWLQGGLGNQLFQLSAGMSAAKSGGRELLVSRASYWRDSLRDFQLAQLVERDSLTTRLEDALVGPPFSRDGALRSKSLRLGLPIATTIPEAAASPSLMVGFFQDPLSIDQAGEELADKLRATPISLANEKIAKLVRGRPVAHVRRGDYVSSASARASFGTISREYYAAALDSLGYNLRDAVFFSDEPAAVAAEFGVAIGDIVGPDDVDSDFQTILLMGSGSDLIMPNSSFSWWSAAILGDRGRVVAPETWFFDRDSSHSPARSHWLRIDNQ